MSYLSKRFRKSLTGAGCAALLTFPASAFTPQETPILAEAVAAGDLPPVSERAPAEPLIVDLAAKGRGIGRHGGTLRTLIAKPKNVKYMVVWGYARLVGYDRNYDLRADILESYDVEDDRVFTLRLRDGHRWSDGHPFTTEDFRYWWEDVANNEDLSPSGPPRYMLAEEKPPKLEILDEHTLRFTWDAPNPEFLPMLAAARPPFIYRPAHYMKQFHTRYTDIEKLQYLIEQKSVRNWAQLHNKLDNLYKNDNRKLPTLQPWINTTGKKGQRFIMRRNPYYHRFDSEGRQLPYIDTVEMTVAASSLFPAKVSAGEVDLLASGLGFPSVPVLKRGERYHPYTTHLWPTGSASHIALYPNLNYVDKGWRTVLRDHRFRRALSLGIDREIINRTLYFGLAKACGNAVLDRSPLYDHENAHIWSSFDPDQANALLDEMGLTERRGDRVRLLPDGRPLEIIVETMGERGEETDALQLIAETWREIGVKLLVRTSDRDILRNRAYAGRSMMTIGKGWDNGLPTPATSPRELAPTMQDTLIWPVWGQYFQTMGGSGAAPDMPLVERLLDLFYAWENGAFADGTKVSRAAVWKEMLDIHAEEQFIIGIVSKAPQPVVASERLRNVPERALYTWAPGAQLGVHRIDEFWFADAPEETASLD